VSLARDAALLRDVNRALSKIGKASLLSLDDPTNLQLASMCQERADEAVGDVCRARPWRRMLRAAELSPSAPEPDARGMFAFELPSDLARLSSVMAGGAEPMWRMVSGGILADAPRIGIEYSPMPKSTGDMPEELRELLSCRMAQLIAPVWVGDAQSAEMAEREWQLAWRKALEIDGEAARQPDAPRLWKDFR